MRSIWPVFVSIGAVAVIVLGAIGFDRIDPHAKPWDDAYRAIQLFGFGGDVPKHPHTALEIARLLAPVVVGYAAIRTLFLVYRQQLGRFWRRWFIRNHVVIAGLGVAGSRMALAFDADHWRVVVIEPDRNNSAVEVCKEQGITVLHSDARSAAVLTSAGVRRANLLIVSCGNDGTNMDVIAAARRVVKGRSWGVLSVLAQLDDFTLWQSLKAQAYADRDAYPLRLEFFNVFALGAEMLLKQYGPLATTDNPHLLVLGLDGVGASLVLGLLGGWTAHTGETRRLPPSARITLAVDGAAADGPVGVEIARRNGHADVAHRCDVATWNVDLASGAHGDVPRGVTTVFICLTDIVEGGSDGTAHPSNESNALTAALALGRYPELRDAPTVLVVSDDQAGIGTTVARGLPGARNVRAFGALARSMTPEALYHTVTERIARLSHERHREQRLADGKAAIKESSGAWHEIKPVYREANRLYADGIPAQLAKIGCVIEPNGLNGATKFSFTPEEIEMLAAREHERWSEDWKRRLRFRHGKVRRTGRFRRRHEWIDVPWAELPEDNKDKDREHVRMMPEVLAHVGFTVRRVE